jgi:hypothetical protein
MVLDAPLLLRSLNDLFVSDRTRFECSANASFKFYLGGLGDIGHGRPLSCPTDIVHFDRSAIPPEEHEAAHAIELNLLTLQHNADGFRKAADLYLFAHTQKLYAQNNNPDLMREMIAWVQMAGRNGAIVAHSFAKIMEATAAIKAPTIWSKADMKERRAASKLFANEFPKVTHVRQAAAHPGELMKNPAEHRRHRSKKPFFTPGIQAGENTYVEGHMRAMNDHLMYGGTFEGEMVQYELSLRKARVLMEVVEHYRRTFYPLEHPTAAQSRVWSRESDARQQQDQSSHLPWWSILLKP